MQHGQSHRIITPYHTYPTSKERGVAKILTSTNHNVTFIPTSQIKTADIIFMHREWEIKSPEGKSPRTIENCLRRALHQSPNIILDLRFTNLPEEKCFQEIKKQIKLTPHIKNLLIITKSSKIIDKFCKFAIIKV